MPIKYKLKLATWTVVREASAPSLRREIYSVKVAGELAIELARSADDLKEHFWLVLLNVKNMYLLHTEVSMGTQYMAPANPTEVFRPAILEGASAIILIHNHPSGDVKPSSDDIALTKRLVEVGRILNIRIHDHIIVGNGTWDYISLAERGFV